MKSLHLSDDMRLPVDACTQTFAWIGRKGSGKTHGSGKLAEELLESSIQVVILDTVGNWFGLRIAQDGQAKGYDIPVFGGLRQDLPLLATAGEVVADVVVDSRRSVILDLSQFNYSDRKRFAADFGARLWQRKKGEADPSPLHLIIEECQLIVPQFVGKDETRMVHVYEEIIRLGRNYGIGVSMLTQRPQSVNKEVLTQAECIMAFQLNGVPERKALKEWLTYEGGDVNLVDALPGLPVGTCYLWSPQWLRQFKKITIAKKRTFDASATPKAGQHRVRRDPAPLDVQDIESRMVATMEKAKADDPKILRAEIARLKTELTKKPVESVKEVPAITDYQTQTLEDLISRGTSLSESIALAVKDLRDGLSTVANNISRQRTNAQPLIHPKPIPRDTQKRDPSPSAGLTSGQQRILDTVKMLWAREIPLSREAVARWIAIHPNGGRFNADLKGLRDAGYLDDQWRLLPAGANLATTLDTGLAALKTTLPEEGQRRIVEVLSTLDHGLSREELAAALGIHPNGGRFNSHLKWLCDMGVIPERGLLQLTDGALN